MGKKFSVNTQIAILIAAWMTMACDMIITPILGDIGNAFPHASSLMTGMAYTIAGFAFIVASLITPRLCRRYSKRSLMLAGAFIAIICGGFGGIIMNLPFIIFMHFVEGFGAGICTNLIPSLIVDISEGEDEIVRLNALNGVIGTVAGFICSSLAGVVAVKWGWQSAYYLFFLGFIVFVWQIIFLPKTSLDEIKKEAPKEHMTARTWIWTIEVFIFSWLVNIMWTYLAVYIDEASIGDAGTAGFAFSLITATSFIGGFLMIPVTKRLKQYSMLFCCACWIISLLITLNAASAVMIYLGALVWGLGQGVVFPYMFANASLIAASNSETLTICWTTIAWYLAVGITTVLYAPIARIFHNPSGEFALKVELVGMVLYLVLVLLRAGMQRRQEHA